MTRNVYAVVSNVFPLVVEVEELVKELFELLAVMFYRLDIHYLTHICTSGRVADHTGAAADEHDRSMSELLHIHHDDDLHEVTHVEAVCRRIESNIELDFLVLKKFSDLLLISRLFYKTSLLQNIIYIVKLADIIRNEIEIHFALYSPFDLFSTVNSVTCISKSRNDVCILVQALILRCDVDVNVRMLLF